MEIQLKWLKETSSFKQIKYKFITNLNVTVDYCTEKIIIFFHFNVK